MKLKIIIIFSFAFLMFHIGISQTDVKVGEQIVKTANAQKTGNWQDVFTNFFQVALKDLAGNNRAFEFRSTLFALKLKANPSLNIDTNYLKHSFDRNFQFNTSLKLDSQYKFSGFKAGFTWAIVNKRDSTILSFIGKQEDQKFAILSKLLADELVAYKFTVPKAQYDTVQGLIQAMFEKGKFEFNKLPADFRNISNREIETAFNEVAGAIKDELAKIRMKPLLTLSVNSAFRKETGIFNGGDAELAYLQGLTKKQKPLELDARINYKVTDTVVYNKRYRNEVGFTGGINIGIAVNSETGAPLIELKPHIEYKRILRGLLVNEKENTFLANATVRIRISRNFWIPFILKYDIENHNFLGFLNASFNWDALKRTNLERY